MSNVYAIDFDDTICSDGFPKCGQVNMRMVDFINALHNKGHYWILYTMREGKYLDDAIEFIKMEVGVLPDAVNDNIDFLKERWSNNPRKVYADYYIDDHNVGGVQIPWDTL